MAVPVEVFVAEKVLAQRHFYEFVKQAWRHACSQPFIDNWHVKLLCDHLQAVFDGRIENLLVNLPPGIGKSIISNVFFVPWAWTRRPDYQTLHVSYGQDLSLRDSDQCRELIRSKWYQQRWGKTVKVRDGADSKKIFKTSDGGYRMSSSVEGQATGEHPHLIIGDDLHKAGHANSPAELRRSVDFWNNTLGTRGVMTGCRRVLIGQRICRGDVSDHAIATKKYVRITLPMEFVPGEMEPTPIGGCDPRTTPGELLFPQAVPQSKVDELKVTLRHHAAAQLQQNPAAPEGALFDVKYFRYVTEAKSEAVYGNGLPQVVFELPRDDGSIYRCSPADCYWFQTIDFAAKVGKLNDYTAIGTFALTPEQDVIVYDMLREQVKIPEQFQLAMTMRRRFPFVKVQAVEDASGGISVIQEGQMKGIDFHVLRAVKDKIDRAGPISRYYQAAKVYHMQGRAWLADYEAELLSFPGQHDDQVDVAAWAGQLVQERSLKRVGLLEADPENLPDIRKMIEAVLSGNSQNGKAA